MTKSILHLVSYYTGQRLYSNLISKLDNLGIRQQVFIPVRTKREIGKYKVENLKHVHYYYSYVLKPYHRLLYFTKIKKTFNTLKANIDPREVQLSHAHSLFSDGGIAYKLKQYYDVPYIVAVRNTDLNGFLKYMPHLRPFGLKILREASVIIFINPSYKDQLFNKYIPDSYKNDLLKKSVCIPNGIDDFWHECKGGGKNIHAEYLKLLYVGSFIKRKNVCLTIQTALRLNEKYNVKLVLVGGRNNNRRKEYNKILLAIENAKQNGLQIEMPGHVEDRKTLQQYYRKADVFLMPSYNETFGLVYIEAISQGTPIIYTKDDGIDGLFKEGKVGYGITSFSEEEVADKVEKILENYDKISTNCTKAIQPYNWEGIAQQYHTIYNIYMQ
ncbi:glycosyltransferase family 4 protein [Sinomicrobium oceani]|uniref:glycosyltransferase family 4 protein n=1 Tax=Sinomicrobium oceani TaxID=1150368 RepID=UPI00227CEC52|nr:glycosyltransferase family 4 protein [Sinomicrobium oceani]